MWCVYMYREVLNYVVLVLSYFIFDHTKILVRSLLAPIILISKHLYVPWGNIITEKENRRSINFVICKYPQPSNYLKTLN